MTQLFSEKHTSVSKPTSAVLRPIQPKRGNVDTEFQKFFGIRDFCGNRGERMFDARSLPTKFKGISLSKRGKVLESGFKKQKNRFFKNINTRTGSKNKRYRGTKSDPRVDSRTRISHNSSKQIDYVNQSVSLCP